MKIVRQLEGEIPNLTEVALTILLDGSGTTLAASMKLCIERAGVVLGGRKALGSKRKNFRKSVDDGKDCGL